MSLEVCALWQPAQLSALMPPEPLLMDITWGPPSAYTGTAATISQSAATAGTHIARQSRVRDAALK